MIRTILAAAALILALAAPVRAEPVVIKPFGNWHDDAPLARLLAKLVMAAGAEDFNPFIEAMTPDATASFGGDVGPEGFKRVYGIGQLNSPFWNEFYEAVRLGGVFIQADLFIVPYTSGDLPETADPYLSVIAIGKQTLLYAEPKEGAKVVADVTHQLLEQLDIEPADLEKTGPDYLRVKADAGEGYVKVDGVRSPLDYRAVFQKIAGEWKLVAFVAGD